MNPRIKFLRKATGDTNFLDEIRRGKRQMNRMETAEGLDSSVQETEQNLFMDTNETIITNGRLVTTSAESETTVAEDDGFSGTVVSGNGVTPFDEAGTFNLAVINDGQTNYGVGQSGTYSNGLDFFNVQKATGASTAERRLRSGFQELQGNDDPSYLFEYLDTNVGANLITSNPNFETGDATGWTFGSFTSVIASSVAGAPSEWGNYCLGVSASVTDALVSDKYACSAGSTLNVSFDTIQNVLLSQIYIRFYNATPTLLSSVLVKSWDAVGEYYATSTTISAQAVAPVGATQFDIYIKRQSSPSGGDFAIDNFSVSVVTISNEFGFHGEDGQLLMGNGKFKTNDLGAYISRGSLSGVVFANNTRTNISTSGNTDLFNFTIPANFFSKGQLRFKAVGYVDQNANNRAMTFTLNLGAAGTVTIEIAGGGANVISAWSFEGTIGKGGTNTQDLFVRMENFTNGAALIGSEMERAQATETEANALACSATLSLSGSVDNGWFENVIVESIMNVDVW